MNYRRRMLDVLEGKPGEPIPWVPRLDLWYLATARAGTLPDKYRNATLMEMVDDLGWGFHAVVPDFQDLRSPEDDIHRGLGFHNLGGMPVCITFDDVDIRSRREGDRTIVEYHTPHGTITTVTLYDDVMRTAGISISHVEKYPFSGLDDYRPLCWLFRRARPVANYDGFAAFQEKIGRRGFAVGYLSWAASPMHAIQRDLMPLDTFFFEMYDRPDQLNELADSLSGYWRQSLALAAESPADVVLLGANYDSAIQYPPFFAEHITPWLAEFAEMLHKRGKYLLTHTDGENRGLLEQYVASKFDVADSVCPTPMTRLSIGEVRKAFAGRITIMGGIPSVALLKDSMTDEQFERFLDDFFDEIGRGDHLILGISDTTPPAAAFDRLVRIAQRVEQFGPVT